MTTLNGQIQTPLSTGLAFAYVADFANAKRWDPGVAASERLDEGPVGVGSRFRLEVRLGGRVAPMEYRISAFEPPNRVVLVGAGSGVSAIDEIRFEPVDGGTRIDYAAEIRLGGLLRLVQPLLGSAFAKVGRDALGGMQRALDDLAVLETASRDVDGGAATTAEALVASLAGRA
jgi:dehydrogenase/reductase SDR family member 12